MKTSTAQSTSPTTLRDRQAQQVRDELRSQFVRLVLDRGIEGFTMQDVADAAGVSVRTLYRYFPSRDAFADDLREHVRRSHERIDDERGPDESWRRNPEFFATTFEGFEDQAELVRAARALRVAGIDAGDTHGRTQRIRAQVEATGTVHPAALDQLVGVLRLLGGSDAWVRLTEEDIDLDARSAGHAVQWAMEVLLREAGKVEGPLRPEGDIET